MIKKILIVLLMLPGTYYLVGAAQSSTKSTNFGKIGAEDADLQSHAIIIAEMKKGIYDRSAGLLRRQLDTPDAVGATEVAEATESLTGDIMSRKKLRILHTARERAFLVRVQEQDSKVKRIMCGLGVAAAFFGIIALLLHKDKAPGSQSDSTKLTFTGGVAAVSAVTVVGYGVPRYWRYRGIKNRLDESIKAAENGDENVENTSGLMMIAQGVGKVSLKIDHVRSALEKRCNDLYAQGREMLKLIEAGKLDVEKRFSEIKLFVNDIASAQRALAEEMKQLRAEVKVVSEQAVATHAQVVEVRAEGRITHEAVMAGREENKVAHARAAISASNAEQFMRGSATDSRRLKRIERLMRLLVPEDKLPPETDESHE